MLPLYVVATALILVVADETGGMLRIGSHWLVLAGVLFGLRMAYEIGMTDGAQQADSARRQAEVPRFLEQHDG